MIYPMCILMNPMKEEPAMLHLHAIGMDIHHHGAFSIQRPHGSGDWLLVIFKTDA